MASPTQTQCRILVLRGSHTTQSELVAGLARHGEVRIVDALEDALDLLRDEVFDLVVSETADFLPLERAAISRQANVILERIGQGVCIIDRDGDVLWSNPKMVSYPPELIEGVRTRCADLVDSFEHEATSDPLDMRARRFSLTIEGDLYFEVTVTPVGTPEGRLTQMAAVVWDNTSARQLQRKIDAIDRAGREIVRLDAEQLSKMDARERLALLEDKIIRYTRDLMHFDNFAIRLLDRETNRLEIVLCAGLPPKAQNLDIFASSEGNGISGYVAATGRSYNCADVLADPRYLPGIDKAHSSLTVPLRLHDQIIGIFNVESDTRGFFSEDDRQFAEIFGRYVAIALHILDLLVVERYTITGQLADSVTAEIAGPLNDIITDASTLMEAYIADEELRRRLQAITNNVNAIKQTIRQVGDPTSGLRGVRPASSQYDERLADKRILVADDESVIRETVGEVLTKYGCQVETARDGREAIAMIQQRHSGDGAGEAYDLVLCDIRMPGPSGYDVFAAVKDADADCPVVLMTGFGYDPNHSIIRARQEGLSAVLFKPFKVDQLLNEVREALAGRSEASGG